MEEPMSTQAQPVSAAPGISPEQAAGIAEILPIAHPLPVSVDEKIENATMQASALASIFNPMVGGLIAAGAEIEPMIFAFTQMIAALYKHHTKS
jgi:hypothetical protein